MAVTTHDDEICIGVSGMRKQHVGDIEVIARNAFDFDFESVTGEVLAHVCTFDLVLLAAFVSDDDHLDTSRSLKERHSVGDRARGGRLPSQQTMTRSSLNGAL